MRCHRVTGRLRQHSASTARLPSVWLSMSRAMMYEQGCADVGGPFLRAVLAVARRGGGRVRRPTECRRMRRTRGEWLGARTLHVHVPTSSESRTGDRGSRWVCRSSLVVRLLTNHVHHVIFVPYSRVGIPFGLWISILPFSMWSVVNSSFPPPSTELSLATRVPNARARAALTRREPSSRAAVPGEATTPRPLRKETSEGPHQVQEHDSSQHHRLLVPDGLRFGGRLSRHGEDLHL